MSYTLVWVPLGDEEPQKISYTELKDSGGKLVYKLDTKLGFGHLELDGSPITGYFKPSDDTESIIRPWL